MALSLASSTVYRLRTAIDRFPLGLPEEYGIHGGAFLDVGSVWGLNNKAGTFALADRASGDALTVSYVAATEECNFYHAHLATAGLRFVNTDVLTRELDLDPYAAAKVAAGLRRELVAQRASFVFETVFSDPVGDKLTFEAPAKLTDH